MDSLNNAIAQLRDLFRSMTPAARVTAGLLLAAVVVSLGYLFAGGGSDSDHLLFGGAELSSGELQAIEAALAGEGIPVDVSGFRVRVPTHRQYEAMGAIAAAGAMPRNLHSIMTEALASGSVFEGRMQSEARLEVAREQYLQMVIRTMMPWVQDAAVNFEEKQIRGFGREDVVTAAVAITPVAGRSLSPYEAKKLKEFTAAWFGRGLTPDKVEITNLHGGADAYGDDPMALAALSDNPYLRDQFVVEESVKRKIADHLRHIQGVRVAIFADLSQEIASQTHTQEFDPKGTSTRLETEVETTESTTAAPTGRVGVFANGPEGSDPTQVSPTTQSKTSVERDSYDNLVGTTVRRTEQVGLKPNDMRASISIPINYLIDTIWKNQWIRENQDADPSDMPMPTEQELGRLVDDQTTVIQSGIENLFPETAAGEDPYPRVQVSFFEADAPEPIPEPTLSETAVAWTTAHWTTLFMFVLALVSLFMLRSMVKSAGKAAMPSEQPTLNFEIPEPVGEPEEDEEDLDGLRPKLKLNKGPSLKDDLAELVREDPDTAATILRAWINQAA